MNKCPGGFSLVELTIATGIFVAASLGITKLMVQVIHGTAYLTTSEVAFGQLQQKLNDLRSVTYGGNGLSFYSGIDSDTGGSINSGEITTLTGRLQLNWSVRSLSLRSGNNGALRVQTGSIADNDLKEVTITVAAEGGGEKQLSALLSQPDFGHINDVSLINRAAIP